MALDNQSHYDGTACKDAMIAQYGWLAWLHFCQLSVFKYRWRADKKGSRDADLQKAAVYERWIAEAEAALTAQEPDDR